MKKFIALMIGFLAMFIVQSSVAQSCHSPPVITQDEVFTTIDSPGDCLALTVQSEFTTYDVAMDVTVYQDYKLNTENYLSMELYSGDVYYTADIGDMTYSVNLTTGNYGLHYDLAGYDDTGPEIWQYFQNSTVSEKCNGDISGLWYSF